MLTHAYLGSALSWMCRSIVDVGTCLAAYAPNFGGSKTNEKDYGHDEVQRLEANEADDEFALKSLLLQTEECLDEARDLRVLPMIGLYVRLRAGDASGMIVVALRSPDLRKRGCTRRRPERSRNVADGWIAGLQGVAKERLPLPRNVRYQIREQASPVKHF